VACCVRCAMGDPLALLESEQRIGDVYGDCDNFQVIVSEGQVAPFRARIGGEFERTNAAVRACGALSPEELAAWNASYEAWRTLAAQEVGVWNANAVARSMCAMGAMLEREREALRAKCAAVGPSKVVNVPHEASELGTTVKWIAGAAIVVGVAYVATMFLPFLPAVGGRRAKA
jgi:hypothetical protein